MRGTPWTDEQAAHLTANYGRMADRKLAAEAGHSYRAFVAKVFKLELKRPKRRQTVPPGARAGFEILVEAILRRELRF